MAMTLNASSMAAMVASYSSRVQVDTVAMGLPVVGLYVVTGLPVPPHDPLKTPWFSSARPRSFKNCARGTVRTDGVVARQRNAQPRCPHAAAAQGQLRPHNRCPHTGTCDSFHRRGTRRAGGGSTAARAVTRTGYSANVFDDIHRGDAAVRHTPGRALARRACARAPRVKARVEANMVVDVGSGEPGNDASVQWVCAAVVAWQSDRLSCGEN